MNMAEQVVSRADYESLVEDVGGQLGGDVDIRDDYSGRYMYGATCLAVVGDNYVLDVFMDAAWYYGIDVSLRNMSEDSMGLSSVFYWPHVRVEKED